MSDASPPPPSQPSSSIPSYPPPHAFPGSIPPSIPANGAHPPLSGSLPPPSQPHLEVRPRHRGAQRHRHRRKRSPAPARPSVTTTAQLKFEARVGVGSRGQVFKASTVEGKAIAVKVMNREDEEAAVEVRALLRLQPHGHIVRVEGEVEYSAENVFLLLEFADTDLLEVVMHAHSSSCSGLPEPTAVLYFNQLAKALRHCHRNSVFHLDVKPENCLLQAGVLKLCDFGSASLRRVTDKASGSVYYAAPEVLPLFYHHSAGTPMVPAAARVLAMAAAAGGGSDSPLGEGMHHHSYDAAAADVWSLGVVLFVMLAGRPPWSEASYYDSEFVALSNGTFHFPEHFSHPAVRLLRSMLQIRPRARPSIADILRDAWVTPFTTATQEVNELEKSMRKHLRFLDAPTRTEEAEHRHRPQSSSRRHHHSDDDASGLPSAHDTELSGREGGMISSREVAPAAWASPATTAADVAKAQHTQFQGAAMIGHIAGAGAGQPVLLAHLSPQSPWPRSLPAPSSSAGTIMLTEAAAHATPYVQQSEDVAPPSAAASPPAPLGLGLKISIAATRHVHDDAMDVDMESLQRPPPALSMLHAAATTSSSRTSNGSGDAIRDTDSPAGRHSVLTRASGSGGVTGGAEQHTPAYTIASSAGARSSRARGRKGERGALTPVVTASQHKLASPLDRVITVEQRLTRSASADIGMMAAILRDNSQRAAEEEQRAGVGASDDDGSMRSSSSSSASSSSRASSRASAPRANSNDAMEQDSPEPSAVPVPSGPPSLSIRITAPSQSPATTSSTAPPSTGLHLRIGAPPVGNMTNESSMNSASSFGTGLSIRGRMPSMPGMRAAATTSSTDDTDDDEGLAPEAVGYGSRFAARRSAQMQAVQAAIAAGATLEQLAPPAMRQDSAGVAGDGSPVGTPDAVPSPSLSIRVPSSAPPQSLKRTSGPTPIGSAALPPVVPAVAPAPLAGLAALPPHVRAQMSGSDTGLPPRVSATAGMHYIPPAAMAAIARARGTSGDIPISTLPLPSVPPPLLPQRSVSSGSSSPIPQLRRVAAIALPSAGSPRALAAASGRNSSVTSLSSLPASNRPRVPSSLGAPPPLLPSQQGTLAFVAAESLLEPEEEGDDGPQFTFAVPGQLLSSASSDGSGGSDAGFHIGEEAGEHETSLPGYHLARISSAARRAVEVQQSAMGICEGFQLPGVQLHPTSRKRSRALASATAGDVSDDMDADTYSEMSEADSEYDDRSNSRASSSVYSDDYSTDMDMDDASSVGGASSTHGSEGATPQSVQRDHAGFVPLLRAHKRGRRAAGDDMYSPAGSARGVDASPRSAASSAYGSRTHTAAASLHARVVSPVSTGSGRSDVSGCLGLVAPFAGAPFGAALRSSSGSSAHSDSGTGAAMADLQAVFGGLSLSHPFSGQSPALFLSSRTPSTSPQASDGARSVSSAGKRRRAAARGDASPRSAHRAGRIGVAPPSASSSAYAETWVDVTDRHDRDVHDASDASQQHDSDDGYQHGHVTIPLRIARPATHYTSDEGSGGSGRATGGGRYTSTGLTALSSISGGSTTRASTNGPSNALEGQHEEGSTSDDEMHSPGVHSRPRMQQPGVVTPQLGPVPGMPPSHVLQMSDEAESDDLL